MLESLLSHQNQDLFCWIKLIQKKSRSLLPLKSRALTFGNIFKIISKVDVSLIVFCAVSSLLVSAAYAILPSTQLSVSHYCWNWNFSQTKVGRVCLMQEWVKGTNLVKLEGQRSQNRSDQTSPTCSSAHMWPMCWLLITKYWTVFNSTVGGRCTSMWDAVAQKDKIERDSG